MNRLSHHLTPAMRSRTANDSSQTAPVVHLGYLVGNTYDKARDGKCDVTVWHHNDISRLQFQRVDRNQLSPGCGSGDLSASENENKPTWLVFSWHPVRAVEHSFELNRVQDWVCLFLKENTDNTLPTTVASDAPDEYFRKASLWKHVCDTVIRLVANCWFFFVFFVFFQDSKVSTACCWTGGWYHSNTTRGLGFALWRRQAGIPLQQACTHYVPGFLGSSGCTAWMSSCNRCKFLTILTPLSDLARKAMLLRFFACSFDGWYPAGLKINLVEPLITADQKSGRFATRHLKLPKLWRFENLPNILTCLPDAPELWCGRNVTFYFMFNSCFLSGTKIYEQKPCLKIVLLIQ